MGFPKILPGIAGLLFFMASTTFAAKAPATPAQSSNSGSVGILGGPAITGASIDTGTQPNYLSGSSVVSYKIGVSGEFTLMPDMLSLELDLLYSKYRWTRNTAGVTQGTNFTTTWWELPLFVNYTGIEMFKFGLGPVFDFSTGDIHTENSDGTGGIDASYSQRQMGTASIGLGFQAGIDYPLAPSTGMPLIATLDLRYVMGLTNLSQISPETDRLHSFDILFGMGYVF